MARPGKSNYEGLFRQRITRSSIFSRLPLQSRSVPIRRWAFVAERSVLSIMATWRPRRGIFPLLGNIP